MEWLQCPTSWGHVGPQHVSAALGFPFPASVYSGKPTPLMVTSNKPTQFPASFFNTMVGKQRPGQDLACHLVL